MGSGEFSAPATMQDLKNVEDRITIRQTSYEEKCEADRVALRGEVNSLKTITTKIEENTQRIANETKTTNEILQPIVGMFRGIFSHPKVQSAALVTVLAVLGFVSYKIHNLTNPPLPVVQQQVPIYIIPHEIPQGDAGK